MLVFAVHVKLFLRNSPDKLKMEKRKIILQNVNLLSKVFVPVVNEKLGEKTLQTSVAISLRNTNLPESFSVVI